jgi:uncharacterized protein (TIGR00255 family)
VALLLSMTGFGDAQRRDADLHVAVEVRTVNNRYFKLNYRGSEGYAALEGEVERIVRHHVRRGTVYVTLVVRRQVRPEQYQLNETALDAYRRQLEALYARWQISTPLLPESLLHLPGVVLETESVADLEHDWPQIEQTLVEALEKLTAMRRREGETMAADLLANCDRLESELRAVEQRAPRVVEAYRARLEERVRAALAHWQGPLEAGDVLREVALFSERSDISEESVRLRSHIDQFRKTIGIPEPSGRKLEFITQEMFREANTIGSKANDAEIAQRVVELKTIIERLREMIQNIE